MAADPLWINASAGAPSYTANELRQAMALAVMHGGRNLGARQGIRPGGDQLQVSLVGSTITIQTGLALVDPALTTTQGPYWLALPVAETQTLTVANASNPRKDIVILRVYDHDEDASGLRLARTEYLVGTAAASPAEPSVPAGSFRLATIDVPKLGTGSPVVTNNMPYTAAPGGLLPVRNAAERNALSASAHDGQAAWRQDRHWLEIQQATPGTGLWRVVTPPMVSSSADLAQIPNPFPGQVAFSDSTSDMTQWRYDGTTWRVIRYRAAITLLTDTAPVTFNIPSTCRDVTITFTARSNHTGFQAHFMRFRVNAIATNSYNAQYTQGAAAALTAGTEFGVSSAMAGLMLTDLATAGVFSSGEIKLNGWNNPHNGSLQWRFHSAAVNAASTTWNQTGGGVLSTSATYASVQLFPDNSNLFKTGSMFTVEAAE